MLSLWQLPFNSAKAEQVCKVTDPTGTEPLLMFGKPPMVALWVR
ncbi:hypothetical protein [Crocosphaera subtropica]|nr:hypothetical protein [Crocosphaera subtropica]